MLLSRFQFKITVLFCNYPPCSCLLFVAGSGAGQCVSPAPELKLNERTIMYFRQRESHSQIIADVQCHTLRCTTCSKTPHHKPPTSQTHPDRAQGHGGRTKYRGPSLTTRWVTHTHTHNEAPRRVLTAHHDKDTHTDARPRVDLTAECT